MCTDRAKRRNADFPSHPCWFGEALRPTRSVPRRVGAGPGFRCGQRGNLPSGAIVPAPEPSSQRAQVSFIGSAPGQDHGNIALFVLD